ncbi:MAG: response regulator transcription factor [Acidobacteriota bacterium]|jgi:FixJ family two-component response regulator
MANTDPIIFVVDDDDAVRRSTEMLIRSMGLRVESFASAAEFLEDFDPQQPGCVILDIRMPGMSGLELQEHLNGLGASIPVIFVTGHGDVPMAVKAMKEGAVDFIQKPFRDQELIDRVHAAVDRDTKHRNAARLKQGIQERIDLLTSREMEVMQLVVEGRANKEIAFDLGLSPRTVEIHRARVMAKMNADSLPDLVRQFLTWKR